MNNNTFNILFLCTGNSARSVLGEGLLNHLGGDKFKGYSAGSNPVGKVNDYALKVLNEKGITGDYSSKSWDFFTGENSPKIDLLITVCNNAANETCPTFPCCPVRVNWEMPDPAAVKGTSEEIHASFVKTARLLQTRINKLLEYPIAEMQEQELKDLCCNIAI